MTFKRASVNLARILALSLCVVSCAWPQSATDKKPVQGTKPAAAQAAKPAAKPPAPAAKPVAKPGPATAAKPPAPPVAAGKSAPAPAAKPVVKPGPASAAKQMAKPGPASAAKPPAAPKSNMKVASKPTAKKKAVTKQAARVAPAGGTPPSAGTGAPEKPESESANKRDPFVPLISQEKGGGKGNLPPGKAGLVVGTVRVDGTVRSQGSMIAVVTNPEQRVYFIRQGDHLYDGDVEKIDMDGVTFRVNSKDAFGRPIERVITKRIYAKAGE